MVVRSYSSCEYDTQLLLVRIKEPMKEPVKEPMKKLWLVFG